MAMETKSDDYKRGLELAEAGKHSEAFEHIGRHLSVSPQDVEALNDAGAILHCLGRCDEAIEHLLRAKELQSGSAEILWNLAEAYIGAGRGVEVKGLFDEMEEIDILSPDIVTRTATLFLDQGDKGNAAEVLLRSQRLWPEQKILEPMLKIIHSKRPKIAFFCGGDGMGFLNEIVEFCKERFEVKIFEGQTEDELYEMMTWSDISWFEWCTNLAVSGTNRPKVCKTIVRLHRYEAYDKWPAEVNWDNVDSLITVGSNVTKQTLMTKVPDLESRTRVVTVPNGINLDKFGFNRRQRGKNIAFVANLRMVKNPSFMLQCMQKLHFIDRGYRLFFAGAFQDLVVEQYVRHMVDALELNDAIFFDGRQDDMALWLANKHYIVSTSICEGHPVGILEGMACGLKPVVHNFPAAKSVFPDEYLFNISEEFCEQILSDSYEPRRYRQFVQEKYSLKRQLNSINGIFTKFESEIDLQGQHSNIISVGSPAGAGSSAKWKPKVFANNSFV